MDREPCLSVSKPGEPKSKGRPRVTRKGFAYTPKDTVQAENEWKVLVAQHVDEADDTSGFSVRLHFCLSTYHRRDIDNLAKLVMDACNGIIWKDDAQVSELHCTLERGCAEASTDLTVYKVPSQLRRV